jgi:uncharacterized protein YxjI
MTDELNSNVLNQNVFLVKEHIGLFKAANNFDIYDPETGNIVMECREPTLGWFTKLLRFSDYKAMTPFDVQIRTPDEQRLVRIQRGISLFRSEVVVSDGNNQKIGSFRQRMLSIGGKFDVFDEHDEFICQLSGKWAGFDFSFANEEKHYAQVTKEWGGIGKELFTSADNYILDVNPDVPKNSNIRKLILAAVMCIDMVLKEG